MVFSSLLFLFYFLAPVLSIYFVIPKAYKNAFLFLVSLFFYAWGEPVYVFLMLFSALFNYFSGFVIEKYKSRVALILNCTINIGLLILFKYADFFTVGINSLLGANLPLLKLSLPIGISFYTFQALSYVIDLYRGKTSLQKNFVSFGLYLSFFPQLIAGPIVRYDDIRVQLRSRTQSVKQFASGIQRFVSGLAKKVLIANNLGALWELTLSSEKLSMFSAWLGILAFTFQIYYDFSGYSDMAIGLGRMFGFEFTENFRYPYISKSVTEFWRRWHISLGSWFREYVYIPLGGSRIYEQDYKKTTKIGTLTLTPKRKAEIRVYLNILTVWLLTGLWHGASLNFVLWGLYYAIILVIEKKFLKDRLETLNPKLRVLYTMFIVIIGWVFFAIPDFSKVFSYILSMFNITKIMDRVFLYRFFSYFIIFACAFIGASGRIRTYFINATKGKLYWVRIVLSLITLLVCIAYLVDDTYNPFLYFRF